ncbi:hypothetical protein [Streptomyces sp. T028]|uniref:hypothetical protein n=1 Tax=Streptomyces sp. T028 TaxID=3394379 RepID=UPI003A878390
MTPRDPLIPEGVWLKFLTDSEEAIRRSAPREPSARERAAHRDGTLLPETDSIGDIWLPDDPWPGPSWRHLDAWARTRRVLRILGAVAALVALLGLFSWLPAEAPGASGGRNRPTAGQSESASDDPPTADGPATPPPVRGTNPE